MTHATVIIEGPLDLPQLALWLLRNGAAGGLGQWCLARRGLDGRGRDELRVGHFALRGLGALSAARGSEQRQRNENSAGAGAHLGSGARTPAAVQPLAFAGDGVSQPLRRARTHS